MLVKKFSLGEIFIIICLLFNVNLQVGAKCFNY